MNEALVQFGLAVCGLNATWWAMGRNEVLRRWAPLLGLVGQAFWAVFAWQLQRAGTNVTGLWVVVIAFALVYARGAWVQWGVQLVDIGMGFAAVLIAAGFGATLVWGLLTIAEGFRP